MKLDNVFFEKPELKERFLKWLNYRNPRQYDLNKMPQFMAYPIIIKWLDTVGLYIDRDTECREMKIWDYREEEPEEAIIVDFIDADSNESSQEEAIFICLGLLEPTKNDL